MSGTGRVPLELCPTSNVHTGAVGSLAEHPMGMLAAGFPGDGQHRQPADERREPFFGDWRAARALSAGDGPDLRWLTINAMKSAFYDFDERLALIGTVIKPGYDALAAEAALPGATPGSVQ